MNTFYGCLQQGKGGLSYATGEKVIANADALRWHFTRQGPWSCWVEAHRFADDGALEPVVRSELGQLKSQGNGATHQPGQFRHLQHVEIVANECRGLLKFLAESLLDLLMAQNEEYNSLQCEAGCIAAPDKKRASFVDEAVNPWWSIFFLGARTQETLEDKSGSVLIFLV